MKKFKAKNILGGGHNRLNKENDYTNLKLEKYKEKNTKKTGIIIFTVACILLITGVFFYTSFASFESKETYNIMEGKVSDPGDIYFAYYIDGQFSEGLPKQNTEYTLDTQKSTCTNGVIPNWNYSTWHFDADYSNYQNETNKRTKCDLYFIKNKTVETALGKLSVYPYTPDFTKSACDSSSCESHEKGIYAMTTDTGTTYYYYRGSVENNYLQFAGYWWRVIRINEDGSVRIIYDGTTHHTNGESSTDRYYGTSQINTSNTRNEYVGYMYTLDDADGLSTSSVIKQANDAFYESHLRDYAKYIDTESGFCGDRSTLNLQSGVGTGTVTTYNKGYLRVTTSSPDLDCENTNDLYTVSGSSKGNKALTYPIGLITVDEVIMAGHGGGVFDGNYNQQKSAPNTYLTIGNNFWTMTPAGGYNPFGGTGWVANVFYVNASGRIDDNDTTFSNGLRPVVNLRSDVTISGEGTIESPYKMA